MTERKEIAPAPAASTAVAATNPLGEIGALLEKMMLLAKDPTVDAGKFATIAAVVKETREDAKREQYYQSKAAAMLAMPVIDKRGKIVIEKGNTSRVQGTYAVWSDLQRAIAPVLAKYDLALTHDIGHDGTVCIVTPVLQHRNGFVEKGDRMALPLDTSGGKNNTQGAGSAASYGKRHTTIAMLGIRLDDTDDDGWLNAAADEPLNDQQQRRVEEAEARWADGPEVFEQWFQRIDSKDRAWLIQTGRYQEITGSSVGRLIDKSASSQPQGGEDKKGDNKAEAWVDRYSASCASAQNLDALLDIQNAAAQSLARLEGVDSALHRRAIEAGRAAYERLQEGE